MDMIVFRFKCLQFTASGFSTVLGRKRAQDLGLSSPGFEMCAPIFSMADSTFSSATSSNVLKRTLRFSRFLACS